MNGLKIHKSRKHEDIPQLDGECSTVRNTDSWWQDHRKISLNTFQKYMDVLKDIEESTLDEEEKHIECEKVTNARKEAFGENYSSFPPWTDS